MDCDTIGIPNRESLLSLCDYKDAVNLVVNRSLSAAKPGQATSGSDSEREEDGSLPVLKLSVMQLCRKLRKVDPAFEFEFVNETFDEDAECVDRAEEADISPVKH